MLAKPDLPQATPTLAAEARFGPNFPSGAELQPDLPPLEVEVRLVLEDERMSLKALYRHLAGTRDEARLDIEDRIAMVREGTEVAILNIQLRHARRAGRAVLVSGLEDAIRKAVRFRPPS